MNTAIVLGAGATKACGGPLTAEILPEGFSAAGIIEREDYLANLSAFLHENFHVPPGAQRTRDFPDLPLLIGLLDIALDHKHSLRSDWSAERLKTVRDALNYVIFAVLEHKLHQLDYPHLHRELLLKLSDHGEQPPRVPTIVSLNYDIIVDNSLIYIGEQLGLEPGYPDYCCDVSTEPYRRRAKFGRLLKLHGSMNWLYCPACHRLDVGISRSGRTMIKALDQLYQEDVNQDLTDRYTCHGSPCLDCGTYVEPVMISPTHMKDYRNPHIARVWYEADRALRQAQRVVFAGYSLPADDVDVIYLLKRSLSATSKERPQPPEIVVVEYDADGRPREDNPVWQRYRSLFGNDFNWHDQGLAAYVDALP
jgi:hypothetical protein